MEYYSGPKKVPPKYSPKIDEHFRTPSVTGQNCKCSKCSWIGLVWDCCWNVDGEGGFGCPECSTVVEIEIKRRGEIEDHMEEIKLKRFDWFFDNHFGIGVRWDDWLYPLHLSVSLPFVTFNFGIGKPKGSGHPVPIVTEEHGDSFGLPRITDQTCECPKCGWDGTVWDCEGDVDGDGGLGCPECSTVVEIK